MSCLFISLTRNRVAMSTKVLIHKPAVLCAEIPMTSFLLLHHRIPLTFFLPDSSPTVCCLYCEALAVSTFLPPFVCPFHSRLSQPSLPAIFVLSFSPTRASLFDPIAHPLCLSPGLSHLVLSFIVTKKRSKALYKQPYS